MSINPISLQINKTNRCHCERKSQELLFSRSFPIDSFVYRHSFLFSAVTVSFLPDVCQVAM